MIALVRTSTKFAISKAPIFWVFVCVALVVRVAFLLYTGREWEDALVTLTTARNGSEGVGLTHHVSEPRVHAFTSPLSVLIPMVGESFGKGILLLQLVSLVATIVTLYYAHEIGTLLSFPWPAAVFLLAYLAVDQIQIFFGMAGMETQIATALMLANVYYYLTRRWWRLGFALGFALLARPEFLFWIPILAVVLLLFDRRGLWPVSAGSALIAGPWVVFATLYYGSPVPQSIIAKSLSFTFKFLSAGWPAIWAYCLVMWRGFAPLVESFYTIATPVPEWLLKVVAAVVAGLALIGIVWATRWRRRLLPAVAFVLAFVVYRTGSVLPAYYMWYLVPFLAVLFLLASLGLAVVTRYSRPVGAALSVVLIAAYAIHIPFSFAVEKQFQQEITEAVFQKVGAELNRLMKPEDTALLEPCGTIGFVARNKTIYDWPGLTSRIVVETARTQRPDNYVVWGMVDVLNPTYLVFRTGELEQLKKAYPDAAAMYEPIAYISAKPGVKLEKWGYRYMVVDGAFHILRRKAGGESGVTSGVAPGVRIGVFRGGQWHVDLNGNGAWDGEAAHRAFTFGSVGDVPVVGDWSGSGKLSVGVFRAGQWLLDLNGNRAWDGAAGGDRQIGFGQAGDLPVVGQWDGGSTSRVGVFRNGTWWLDVNGNGVWDGPAGGDKLLIFGLAGDLPVVGDWNGSGKTSVGVYRKGQWFLDVNGNGVWDGPAGGDQSLTFGGPGDVPVVGRWDNSSKSRIGTFRAGQWLLDANGSGGWNGIAGGDHRFKFGASGDTPVTGRF